MMKTSNFESPAYGVQRIKIEDLVSQKANPNSMTGKSWDALQQSIFNTGYTFPVIAAVNTEYDPSTEGQPKPDLIEHSDGENTFTSSGKVGTQVSDDEIAKFFPYRLIDGSHRTQIVRLGTYWFNNGHDHSNEWIDGKNVPEKPGLDMLAYLAWRENFTVPVVLLDIDETKQMSAEILHNAIWEDQKVKVMRKRSDFLIITKDAPVEASGHDRVLVKPENWIHLYNAVKAEFSHSHDGMMEMSVSDLYLSIKGVPEWKDENRSLNFYMMDERKVLCFDHDTSIIDMVKNPNKEVEILWKDLQVGDVFAEDFETKWSVRMLSNEVFELEDGTVPIRARWNDDGTFTHDPDSVIKVPVAELKSQIDGGRAFAYAGPESCIDRTIFEIIGGPSIVTGIDEWTEKECYELLLVHHGVIKDLVLSNDHLVKVNKDLLLGKLDSDFLKKWMSESDSVRKAVQEEDESWVTIKSLFELSKKIGDLWEELKEVRFFAPHLHVVNLRNLGMKKCRCISTSRGNYTINGVLNHNTARGAHSLDSMKDIVYNLINVAGMSEEWVAQNLYLDLESIKRMQQLSGLKAAMSDIDDADMAWTPESDDSYGRKLQSYLTREATKYIELWKQEHKDEPERMATVPLNGTAVDIAITLGFNHEEVMKRHAEEWKHIIQS